MKINLRSDAKTIYDYLRRRVADYPVYINIGPGKDADPISQVTLGFQVAQAGWVAPVFDTRPDGSPDGEWQSHIEGNRLEFPQWQAAADAQWQSREPIELLLPDGKRTTLGQDDHFSKFVGKMLKGVLLQARKDNCFKALSRAPKCSMGVEDHDGAYGWPAYEKRYTDGRVT